MHTDIVNVRNKLGHSSLKDFICIHLTRIELTELWSWFWCICRF